MYYHFYFFLWITLSGRLILTILSPVGTNTTFLDPSFNLIFVRRYTLSWAETSPLCKKTLPNLLRACFTSTFIIIIYISSYIIFLYTLLHFELVLVTNPFLFLLLKCTKLYSWHRHKHHIQIVSKMSMFASKQHKRSLLYWWTQISFILHWCTMLTLFAVKL